MNRLKFKIKKPLAYNFPPPPLYRLNQWIEKSCKDTGAEKIYSLLYERFFQEVRKDKKRICRPQLTNGLYNFQRPNKKEWKLSELKPKVKFNLTQLIP